MSEVLHFFAAPHRSTVVSLPFSLTQVLADWGQLRKLMVRKVPEVFTREEWAYLATFVDPSNLRKCFLENFGDEVPGPADGASILARPRGPIAIWLPNNVSLLGPLILILASLTGAPIRVKAGSRSDDLTAAFVNYALEQRPEGSLASYLKQKVRIEQFDRQSPRNAEMAAEAMVRVVFGSDAAVAAVEALPHPAESVLVGFGNHCSEAWVELPACTEDRILELIKVFAIYGRSGCTSPRRVVVLNGSPKDAELLRQRMTQSWPKAISKDVPMHIASLNVMDHQLALANGWQAALVPRHAAMLASGGLALPEPAGLMSLTVTPATTAEAVASLPPNIQTVGHCLINSQDPVWLEVLARTYVKRFVPIAAMHHFGSVWDGFSFWRLLFAEVVLRP